MKSVMSLVDEKLRCNLEIELIETERNYSSKTSIVGNKCMINASNVSN